MPDAHATAEALSDEALARRVAAGPPGATRAEEAELYRRFAPRVRLYGRRHLRDDAASEDLAHDVLMRTIERLRAGDVRRPEEIGSFILGTSRMMAQSQRRRARRRDVLASQFLAGAAAGQAPTMVTLDARKMATCLRGLAERDRLVVLLSYYANLDAPRIAHDLGVTPGAVRVIRHRALARLRECVFGGGQP